MSENIKDFIDLTPVEPTLKASDIKKKLFFKVKEMDSKAKSVLDPRMFAFMIGQYSVLKSLYEELFDSMVSDEEIRSWNKDYDSTT